MAESKRFPFTADRLEKLACPPSGRPAKDGKAWAYDTKTTGLTFCVTEGGKRAFYWYRRTSPTVVRRHRLGYAPEMTVDAARKLAGAMNSRLDAGVDPVAEIEQKQAAVAAAAVLAEVKATATVGKMWEGYNAHHLNQKKQRTRDEFTRLYDAHIAPTLANREAATVTTEEIESLKLNIAKAHGNYTANRTLAILSSMFSQRAKKLPNPVKDVTRYDENIRKRVLSDDELARIIDAINADENPIVQDFFTMLWLTGARKTNVAEMQFQNISKNKTQGAATWTIPGEQTKNGDPLTVALPAKAVEIINRREASNPEGSPFVFPGRRITAAQVEAVKASRDAGKSTHAIAGELGISQTAVMRALSPDFNPGDPSAFVGAAKAWERILKRAGITRDLPRIHDVRRTFGTHLAESGASLQVAANIMGHKSMETTLRVYSHARAEAVQTAHLESVTKMEARVNKARKAAEAEKPKGKGNASAA